jgi:ATP-dependent RNA helicase DeaD
VEASEEDRALAARLLAKRSPEDIAAALVQVHRSRLPEPEDLMSGNDAGPPAQREPRAGFEQSTWFRVNIGRAQNADPRWILPLLCRRGHVSRTEIGAIRITGDETLFEVQGTVAARFLDAVRRTADEGDEVEITQVEGGPREEARHRRRDNASGAPVHRAKPAHAPKPYRHPARGNDQARPGGAGPVGKGPKKGTWRSKPDRAK